MRRRELIAGLGSAAAWPLAVRAQQPGVPVIGFISPQSTDGDYSFVTVRFLQGLKETGFVEGRNVAIEHRWAENQLDRLPAFAAALVRLRVAVIVTSGLAATRAAKEATATIPIVFVTGGDPVALGLVASLNRPGANVTGSTALVSELAPKRLQLLHELVPDATLFGALVNPTVPRTQSVIPVLQAAARLLGVHASIDNDRLAAVAMTTTKLACMPGAFSRCYGAAAGSIYPSLH
jgi:putative ABC transport system substrate-binding protein